MYTNNIIFFQRINISFEFFRIRVMNGLRKNELSCSCLQDVILMSCQAVLLTNVQIVNRCAEMETLETKTSQMYIQFDDEPSDFMKVQSFVAI